VAGSKTARANRFSIVRGKGWRGEEKLKRAEEGRAEESGQEEEDKEEEEE